MTTDEIRDELAGRAGYTISPNGIISRPEWGEDHVACVRAGLLPAHDHPMPPTLDGANAAVPEGWTWKRYTDTDDGEVWAAWKEGVLTAEVNVPDHGRGHEMDDLYQLALACVRAEEATNGKA